MLCLNVLSELRLATDRRMDEQTGPQHIPASIVSRGKNGSCDAVYSLHPFGWYVLIAMAYLRTKLEGSSFNLLFQRYDRAPKFTHRSHDYAHLGSSLSSQG